MLECDAAASCLYVNEPKVKVDLTKYVERHTFRCASSKLCCAPGRVLCGFVHSPSDWMGWPRPWH